MTITVLASLAGSPGVTTAAVAMGIQSRKQTLLIEADILNASSMMPGFLRSNFRPQDAGIERVIAAAGRRILERTDFFNPEYSLSIALHRVPSFGDDFPLPALPKDHRLWVVPGFFHLNVADGVRSAWAQLTAVLQSISNGGVDVIIDLSRLTYNDARLALIDIADRVIFCAELSMIGLNRTVRRLKRDDLAGRTDPVARGEKFWILPIEPAAEAISRNDFAEHTLPLLPSLPHDSTGAAVFSHGRPDTKPGRNRYRSAIRRVLNETYTNAVDVRSGGK